MISPYLDAIQHSHQISTSMTTTILGNPPQGSYMALYTAIYLPIYCYIATQDAICHYILLYSYLGYYIVLYSAIWLGPIHFCSQCYIRYIVLYTNIRQQKVEMLLNLGHLFTEIQQNLAKFNGFKPNLSDLAEFSVIAHYGFLRHVINYLCGSASLKFEPWVPCYLINTDLSSESDLDQN